MCQEALKTKAPKVTTNLNLSGKYMVVTTEKPGLGISAKLEPEDRKKLKNWVSPLMREDCGVIIRTNAAFAEKKEILEELDLLYQRMEFIAKKGKNRTCYSLLEQAPPFYLRALQDAREDSLQNVVTDLPDIFNTLREYCQEYRPQAFEKIHFYQDSLLPLGKLYSLEHALTEATREKVWLKSGGFLVIQQTEAFVAVDVNSGKFTTRKKASEAAGKSIWRLPARLHGNCVCGIYMVLYSLTLSTWIIRITAMNCCMYWHPFCEKTLYVPRSSI